MHVVPVALQIDPSGQTRIVLIGDHLHLEGKSQIFIYVRIFQISDVSRRLRVGQAIEKHEGGRGLSVQLRHQLSLQHRIPVQIDHHLDGGILRQDLLDGGKGNRIGIIPAFHIIFPRIMDDVIAVFFPQNLSQKLSRSHDAVSGIPGHGIHKCLLGMGMINEDLRNIRILFNGQILTQKLIQLHLIRTRLRGGVHRIKTLDQRVKILIVAPVIFLRTYLCLHETKSVFPRCFSLNRLHSVSGYLPLYAVLYVFLSASPACLIFLLKLLLRLLVQT